VRKVAHRNYPLSFQVSHSPEKIHCPTGKYSAGYFDGVTGVALSSGQPSRSINSRCQNSPALKPKLKS
jgi:hypothetical protein